MEGCARQLLSSVELLSTPQALQQALMNLSFNGRRGMLRLPEENTSYQEFTWVGELFDSFTHLLLQSPSRRCEFTDIYFLLRIITYTYVVFSVAHIVPVLPTAGFFN